MSFSYIETSIVKLSVLGAAAMAIAATCNTLIPVQPAQNNQTAPVFSVSSLHHDAEPLDVETTLAYRASGRFDSGINAVAHRATGRIDSVHQLIAYRASGRLNSIDNQVAYRGSERGINQQSIA